MSAIKKVYPCLWFDSNAEEAVNFYLSVFKNGRIHKTTHFGKAGYEIHKRPEGSVMTIDFELEGQFFMALNGGPYFQFNEAVSIVIECETQEELDDYWNKLSEGGDPNAQQCGWLKDRYGLSWQVVPSIMNELTPENPTPASEKLMEAMLKMKKLDIAALKKAADQ
ncbi:VOC family protein [Sediminibacterium soli]|uniref:VOC family protein n=1 Tax=Sediminibacterium soli TaxID=2698829 RepID=UPI001379F578|nr:VOC family protein [Sediminibacterium soli]NCI47875.1 VOC family protein [Sediminibacterium soli]